MRAGLRLDALVLAAMALVGCKSYAYQCASSSECTQSGATGTCESTGYCSFSDPSCDSGRRYGEYAASSYSDECVGATEADAGIDTSGPLVTKTFGEVSGASYMNVTFDADIRNMVNMTGDCCAFVTVQDDLNWALVRWTTTAMPAGVKVVRAEAEVSTNDATNLLVNGKVSVYRVLEAWEEGSVSYYARTSTAGWTNLGAGAPMSRSADVLHQFSPTVDSRYTIPLPAAMVQQWIDNPAANNGILFDTDASVGKLYLASHEHADPTRRPLLRIVYSAQ